MSAFNTHDKRHVTQEQLQKALSEVAQDWRNNARAIYKNDRYASHVTQQRKDANLADALDRADSIEAGEIESFTIWQRVNQKLTGECVALLTTKKG